MIKNKLKKLQDKIFNKQNLASDRRPEVKSPAPGDLASRLFSKVNYLECEGGLGYKKEELPKIASFFFNINKKKWGNVPYAGGIASVWSPEIYLPYSLPPLEGGNIPRPEARGFSGLEIATINNDNYKITPHVSSGNVLSYQKKFLFNKILSNKVNHSFIKQSIENINKKGECLDNIDQYLKGILKNKGFYLYQYNKNNQYLLERHKLLSTRIIEHFFQKLLISRPTFKITNSEVVIQLFYYTNRYFNKTHFPYISHNWNYSGNSLYFTNTYFKEENKVAPHLSRRSEVIKGQVNTLNLIHILSNIFGIRVNLKLIRLHYPYLNSYILAKFIAYNTKQSKFSRIQRNLFKKIIFASSYPSRDVIQSQNSRFHPRSKGVIGNSPFLIPKNILGLKLQISGRMNRRKTASRSSIQTKFKGSFKFNKIGLSSKSLIDFSKYSFKNKNGAFTVSVWLSGK